MKLYIKSILLLLGVLLGCSNANIGYGDQQGTDLTGIKGILSLSETYSKNDTIVFLNPDGSIWYKFSFFYDDSDGKFEYYNPSFNPLAFHQDYFLLSLAVVDELQDRFVVIVDHQKGFKKHILKTDYLQFHKVDEFILTKVFSVGFNKSSNPIRIGPNEKSTIVKTPENVFFHPKNIKGNWLQVKWQDSKGWQEGWIMWKRKEKLIIELFFFA